MKVVPVVFVWRELDVVDEQGVISQRKVMDPLPRYGNVCARQFHEDEEYVLVILETRSRASHNHYFACVEEGFKNLPETIAARWQEADHLRKWTLIECGWCHEQEFKFDSTRQAKDAAAQFVAFCRMHDTYVRVHVSGKTLIVRSAKSQAAKAMGKDAFEKSKKDVLDMIEHMIGVAKGTLDKEAGKSA